MNREHLKSVYSAVLQLATDLGQEGFREELDASLRSRVGWASPGRELWCVADCLSNHVRSLLGEISTGITDESWETGMFLTGGHTHYRYDKPNAWLAQHGLSDFIRENCAT